MKTKYIICILLSVIAFSSCDVISDEDKFVEIPADVNVKDKTALLVEFTGWKCPNCPAAAEMAHSLLVNYPNNLIVVGMHPKGHGFTTPENKVNPLGTDDAMILLEHYEGGVSTPFPKGVVNGKKFANIYLQDKDYWPEYVKQEVVGDAECTINIHKEIKDKQYSLAIEITPKADMNKKMSLQLWLIENDIIAPQASVGTDYKHQHVFRQTINGDIWGEELGTITETTTKEYSFKIDSEKYVANNCSVVAVLINTDTKEVIQAAQINLGE